MGAGNFYIKDAETVYVDDSQIFYENEDGEIEYDDFYYDDLIDHVRETLPKSYCDVDKHFNRDSGKVIAENDFYEIVVTGWEGYYAVSVALKESDYDNQGNMYSLAKSHLDKRAKQIFDKLSEYYDLRVRSSGWTSGPYEKAA